MIRIRTRYQRMAFARAVSEAIEKRSASPDIVYLAKVIGVALSAPVEVFQGMLEADPQLRDIAASVQSLVVDGPAPKSAQGGR